MTHIGFVGLGNQGAPIARRIIQAGYPTTLYARRAQTIEPFNDTSADVAPTLRDLGARSDVIFICVVNDQQVTEITTPDNLLGGIKQGAVIVILSTVAPETCRRIGVAANAHGASVMDAAVSGGGDVASRGELTLMVGADDPTYERCLPILQTFGSNIHRLGGLGMGSAGKLLNNFLFTGNLVLAMRALQMGAAAGIPHDRLLSFLATASGRSFSLTTAPGFLSGNTHAFDLLRKDIELMQTFADSLGESSEEFAWLLRRLEAPPP